MAWNLVKHRENFIFTLSTPRPSKWPSAFTTKVLYASIFYRMRTACPTQLILFNKLRRQCIVWWLITYAGRRNRCGEHCFVLGQWKWVSDGEMNDDPPPFVYGHIWLIYLTSSLKSNLPEHFLHCVHIHTHISSETSICFGPFFFLPAVIYKPIPWNICDLRTKACICTKKHFTLL